MDTALADPQLLVEGLRYLQQRIPDFVVLDSRARRSMANAAHLPPEMIDIGIQAAQIWEKTPLILDRTGDELRREADEIRHWDEVARELHALAKGITDANLKRKHSLGTAILRLYTVLEQFFRGAAPESYLRPLYDNMKAVFLRTRRKQRKSE